MNSASLTILAWSLLALACGAASADSGPAVGEEAVPFDPFHVTGPHAGKEACPLCVYGMIPGVQIWATAEGLDDAARIATWVEPKAKQLGAANFKSYILYIPRNEDRSTAAATVQERTRGVSESTWRLVVPGPDDEHSTRAYSIDPKTKTTTLVYVNRRVAAKFTDLGATDADREKLLAAIDAAGPTEVPYPDDSPRAVPLCDENEPGRKIMFWGRVWDEDGRPLPKAAVLAYNTGEDGLYNPPKSGTRTPRIRGVTITDDRGFYRFKTVWPGAYPNADDPAHLHFAAVAASHHLKYLLILFKGDPKITPAKLAAMTNDGEDPIVVDPQKQPDGSFVFRQDIRLEGN